MIRSYRVTKTFTINDLHIKPEDIIYIEIKDDLKWEIYMDRNFSNLTYLGTYENTIPFFDRLKEI